LVAQHLHPQHGKHGCTLRWSRQRDGYEKASAWRRRWL
jgi:hypothetical protein